MKTMLWVLLTDRRDSERHANMLTDCLLCYRLGKTSDYSANISW